MRPCTRQDSPSILSSRPSIIPSKMAFTLPVPCSGAAPAPHSHRRSPNPPTWQSRSAVSWPPAHLPAHPTASHRTPAQGSGTSHRHRVPLARPSLSKTLLLLTHHKTSKDHPPSELPFPDEEHKTRRNKTHAPPFWALQRKSSVHGLLTCRTGGQKEAAAAGKRAQGWGQAAGSFRTPC